MTVAASIPISKLHGGSDPDLTKSVPTPKACGSDSIGYTISRAPGEEVGKYMIFVDGEASQGNYIVTFQNGLMFSIISEIDKIIERPQVITGLTYDGTDQIGVPEGVGYTLNGVWKEKNANGGNPPYSVTVVLESGYSWVGGGTDSFVLNWTIAQKNVDVIVKQRVVKLVGASDPENYNNSIVIEGNIPEDGYSITYITSREAGEVIGDYMIYVTGDASQGNYKVNFYGEEMFFIEGNKVDRPVARTGLVYNGHVQTGVVELDEYSITGNQASAATRGTTHHIATVTINVGYEWKTSPEDRSPFNIEWDIAPLGIEVRADKPLNKLVGAADPDFNGAVTVHGLVDNYAVTYLASCIHSEAIGAYDVTVSGDAVQGNYDVTFIPGHHMFMIGGTVIDKPVPVKVVYNSTTQTGVLPGTGYTITGNTGINATRGTPIIAHADIEVGYEWAGTPGMRSTLDIPWEIDPAMLAAVADSQAVEEGEPAQPFTVSFHGFFGSDDESVVTIESLAFECDYTPSSGQGVYDIVLVGTFQAANYDFILEDGIVLCGKEVIDKPVPVIGLKYSGWELIGVMAGYGYTVTNEKATFPGTYVAIVTPDEQHVWSDATSGPFELHWEISKADLIITADDQEVYVGNPAAPFTATVEGFVHGEGMSDLDGSLFFECGYTTTSPAGNYTIVPSGVSSDNYEIDFQNGTLTATKHDPKPRPDPPVIPVSVTFKSTAGGYVNVDSLNVPLNSKVTVNGDMLIFGTGPSAKIVKAVAEAGYVFDSWSVEDGQRIMKDMDITASFKKVSIIEISVWESPDKISYGEGDKFDPEGMVILVTYNDGSLAIIGYDGNESDFSFNPSLDTPLKVDDAKVTVIYGGHSAEVPITVSGPEKEPFPWLILLIIIIVIFMIIVIWRYTKSEHKN